MELRRLFIKPYRIYIRKNPHRRIYALFRLGAQKIGCNLSSTIFHKDKLPFVESRKSGIRKAVKEGIEIKESNEFNVFWKLLEENLITTHGTFPVHSLPEIQYLHSKFPNQIKLYVAKASHEIIAGTVLFVMKNVIHVQYISASINGKKTGALDLLFDKLINSIYCNIPIFDFG